MERSRRQIRLLLTPHRNLELLSRDFSLIVNASEGQPQYPGTRDRRRGYDYNLD
jgi:hypothetical protein